LFVNSKTLIANSTAACQTGRSSKREYFILVRLDFGNWVKQDGWYNRNCKYQNQISEKPISEFKSEISEKN